MQDAKVVPQPPAPAKVDSDQDILYIKVRLSGHFAPNRQVRRPTKRRELDRQLDRQFVMSDGMCRERLVDRVISTLNQPIQPRNTSGTVAFFTTAMIDAVDKEVPPPACSQHRHGW